MSETDGTDILKKISLFLPRISISGDDTNNQNDNDDNDDDSDDDGNDDGSNDDTNNQNDNDDSNDSHDIDNEMFYLIYFLLEPETGKGKFV